MFCYIRARGYYENPVVLANNFENNNRPIDDKTTLEYKSIDITINKNGKYLIEGSAWKKEKGNNYGTFSIKEFSELVEELNSLTFGTFIQSHLTRLEYGININTKLDPKEYLSSLAYLKENERIKVLFPSYSNKRLWKVDTQESHKLVKIYSKTQQAELPFNCLRLERVLVNVKQALKRDLTIQDLLDEPTYKSFIEDLRNIVDGLHFNPKFLNAELKKLTAIEKYICLLIEEGNPELINRLKQLFSNRKTCLNEIRRMTELTRINNINNELYSEIKEKALDTINKIELY